MQTDTVVAIPADAVARETLLRRLSALARIDHPAVEPVGAAVARPDGALVVPRGAEHATDLATILTVRGRCTVAEASGLAVDVAQGLAALHSEGVVHGVLDLTDVVIRQDGRPCLRPRLDLPTAEADESADVHHLARLVDSVVGPQDGDDLVALRAALAPALADDPRVRPEAGTLAARVHDAVPPEPIRVPDPAALAAAALARRAQPPEQTTATHRRARRTASTRPLVTRAERRAAVGTAARRRPGSGRRSGRVVLGVVAVGAVVAALVVVGLQIVTDTQEPQEPSVAGATSGATTQTGAAPVATAAPGATATPGATAAAEPAPAVRDQQNPASAAAELTRARVAMLTGEVSVDEVAVAGSPAHEAATEERARAEEAGVRVQGAEVEVTDVRAVPGATTGPGTATAEVEVDYVVGPHEQVATDGAVVQVPRGEPRTDVLRLAWTDDGWRVTDVL